MGEKQPSVLLESSCKHIQHGLILKCVKVGMLLVLEKRGE